MPTPLSAARLRFGPYVASTSSRLGSGHYGTVLAGVHAQTGASVAIKLEGESSASSPRLSREAGVYRDLNGAPGFPRMRWYGRAHGFFAIVLDRLGPSLREVHRAAGLTMSCQAVRHIGEQALQRLEALHDAGWLHCDMKPANLLLPSRSNLHADGDTHDSLAAALTDGPPLFCVDYGLSRRWADVPLTRREGVVGTGRYASLSNHSGAPLGRRDDVESTLLTLAYLRSGRLPWSGVKADTKRERFAMMLESKQATSVTELSMDMPHGFEDAFKLVRALEHNERPPYDDLRRLVGPAEVEPWPSGEQAVAAHASTKGRRRALRH